MQEERPDYFAWAVTRPALGPNAGVEALGTTLVWAIGTRTER
jgi:hypothetical protein